jgi:hypothetical protein
MANLIKIKRSTGTATPPSLAEGELAVSFLSGKLFVGNTTAVIPIGGVHSPGTLTANQALVANATSGIDKVIVANLVPAFVYANGAFGTDGQVLLSNSTGGVYWGQAASSLNDLTDVTISSVANNELLIYDAASNQWENHSVSGNTGQVNVAFASQNITVSLVPNVVVDTTLTVGNSTVNSVVNSTAVSTNTFNASQITVGSNVSINTSTIFIGNSTVNTTIQAGNIALRGTQISIGPDLVIDGNTIIVGNSTVNTVINSSSISVDGEVTSGNTNITGVLTVGNSSVNAVVNSTSVTTSNLAATNAITVGSNVTVNTSSFFVGNSTVNTFVTSTSVVTDTANATTAINVGANVNLTTTSVGVGNTTVNTVVTSTAVTIASGVKANTTGFFPTSNTVASALGSTTRRWVLVANTGTFAGAVSGITTLAAGNTTITGFANVTSSIQGGGALTIAGAASGITTLAAGNTTITGFITVGNSTVNTVINSTAVSTGSLSVANLTVSGDLLVQGNTALGNATSDVVSIIGTVNTSIIPTANLTYSLGNNTLYWAEVHAGNVHADFGYFNQDVAIYGDLTVAGNLVTTNVQSVVISDPMIYLAGNNTSSDLVDIGFVGNYFQSATSKHAGLIRDASVDQFYLFKGLTQDLEAQLTVNTADPTFALADLNAFLLSGALVSNSLAVTITANSTVNVNITANSLLLSTALTVNSGGTGLSSVTAKGILYGNTTGPLGITSAGTDGQVLQANSTGFPVFADLDGGTF